MIKKYTKIILISLFILNLFLILFYVNVIIDKNDNLVYPILDKHSIFRKYNNQSQRNVVYGYLPWWQISQLQYIELDKITDIAFFGIHVNKDGTIKKVDSEFNNEPGYNTWVENEELKNFINKAKKYKVRVSLTLISHDDSVSNAILDCEKCWNTLANNLYSEMNKHKITDLNINFEYVNYTPAENILKYIKFVDFLNKFMDNKFGDSFVVSSAFADSIKGQRLTSDIRQLAQVSDGIFIMGYDFHVPTSSNAGPIAPYDKIYETVNQFLSLAPANKIILGVPYYGYDWVVDGNVLGASRIEGNDEIGYSQSQTYAYIIDLLNNNNYKVEWLESTKTPYFNYIGENTSSNRQVHFENVDSLKEKYNLIKSKNLLGVGIWALGYDTGRTELWDLLEREFWQL